MSSVYILKSKDMARIAITHMLNVREMTVQIFLFNFVFFSRKRIMGSLIADITAAVKNGAKKTNRYFTAM